MATHRILDGLHLIDLNQDLHGFRRFISSWVVTRGGATLVVDPGPRSTIPVLLAALDDLGVRNVDAVLLTHIHIDHAGGAGLLTQHYPDARFLCHPKGIPHMVDPEKLWQGSLKVLGAVADAYGPIQPIHASRIGSSQETQFGSLTLRTIPTPGHAAHHQSFQVGDLLFAGEAAGVRYPLEEEGAPDRRYQRPATPPRFLPEIFCDSLRRLRGLDATHLCYGHYGIGDDPDAAVDRGLGQIDTWLGVVRKHLEAGATDLPGAVFAELLEVDPLFATFPQLPEDVQQRERHFFGNSVNGMQGYLEAQRAAAE